MFLWQKYLQFLILCMGNNMKKLKILGLVILCFVALGLLTYVAPSATTYIKYDHVYDWNDPNSDKFDPMRLDMGYYQGAEKDALVKVQDSRGFMGV